MMPSLVTRVVRQAHDRELRVPVESREFEALKQTIRDSSRRRDAVLVAATLLLGGVLWFVLEGEPRWPGAVLAALGTIGIVRRWWRD